MRRRRHRARQQDPEEGAHLSAGVRRPWPAPPRARPMRPAAQRGDGAFGAGLHGPRGVRERGIVPVKNAWLAVADPPPARTRPPPRRSRRRRRLIYKMVGMPTISLPAPLGRLPRRRPKWANRGEWPAPLPIRRKKRRERRSSYLANPRMIELSKAGCGGSSTRMGGKAPAVTIARAGETPTALRNPPARRNNSGRIRTFP